MWHRRRQRDCAAVMLGVPFMAPLLCCCISIGAISPEGINSGSHRAWPPQTASLWSPRWRNTGAPSPRRHPGPMPPRVRN